MTRQRNTHRPTRYLVLAAILPWVASGLALATEMQQSEVARGRSALLAGQYADAVELLTSAQETQKREAGVVDTELQLLRAIALQRRGEEALQQQPEESGYRFITEAARIYQALVNADPGSGVAANNLARALGTLGRSEEAARWYQHAIDLGNSHQALYLQSYAAHLDEIGDTAGATRIYGQLIANHVAALTLHPSLLARARAIGNDAVADYLWQVLDVGWIDEAATGALSAAGSGDRRFQAEMLGLLCQALSLRGYDPQTFAFSELGRGLADLEEDSEIGEGGKTVLLVHVDPTLDPADYRWWSSWGDPVDYPPRGVWPVEGFRSLVRALGSRAARAGARERAERCFRLAARVERHNIDPEAVRRLVRLKIDAGDLAGVARVLDEYEKELFAGKSYAYRGSQLEKTFQFHRTLGELYAFVGRWSDSSFPTRGAIFQLEHAQWASEELSQQDPTHAQRSEVQFTPEMTVLLADGYAATGNLTASYELRLAEAERQLSRGDTEAAVQLVEPLAAAHLSPALKERYRALPIVPQVAPSVSGLDNDQAIYPDLLRNQHLEELTPADLKTIEERLQRTLTSGHHKVQIDWSGLPGVLQEVRATDPTGGVLVLKVDGELVELHYHVTSPEKLMPLVTVTR